MSSPRRSVLLLDATGLVGQECLRLLIDDDTFSQVVVLARRPLQVQQQASRLMLANRAAAALSP